MKRDEAKAAEEEKEIARKAALAVCYDVSFENFSSLCQDRFYWSMIIPFRNLRRVPIFLDSEQNKK